MNLTRYELSQQALDRFRAIWGKRDGSAPKIFLTTACLADELNITREQLKKVIEANNCLIFNFTTAGDALFPAGDVDYYRRDLARAKSKGVI